MKVNLDDMSLPIEVGGVTFRNPFYVSSGPTSKSLDHLLKAAETGWAGASIKLTFDPAPYVNLEPRYGWFKDAGFLSFSAESRLTIEEGLQLVRDGRRETKDFILMANITYVGDKPAIEGWVEMAKRFEDAGSHVIELNMCCPNMSYNVAVSGTQGTAHQTGASLGQQASALAAIVEAVKNSLSIPLFVKVTPEGGHLAEVAKACLNAGADAIGSNSNRLGVPPIDIRNPEKAPYALQKEPSMSCLCGPWLRPLALRDVYEMRKCVGPDARLTATGGLMEMEDFVEAAMCGADLIGVCTGILLKGFEMLPPAVAALKSYMKEMGYTKFTDMRDILVKEIAPSTELTITKGYARKKSDTLRGPCQVACPFDVPAQDYVTLVAEGDFESAYKMIMARNPLQSVCGWVCNHPCETECTRAEIDEPVRIRDIKRFVIERGAKEGWEAVIETGPKRDEKIAIVGSGPAGLSAAYHLARAGYQVNVFEAQEKLGGMLRYAIPRFRLPESVLDAEIETLRALGVEFVTGKSLGNDFTIESLKQNGHKAVIVAVGAGAGVTLDVPGEEGPGCMTALEFLYPVAKGTAPQLQGRVAVIGGGFTAVDTARTAVRLGAKEVYLLYRRTRNEMPATSEEVDEAEAEGVKVMYLVSPREIVRENGAVKAIRMVNHVLSEQDASGRRRPEEVEGTEFTLAVEHVVTALAQRLDDAGLGVDLSKGTIATGSDGVSTNVEGIFAAGDAATGGDSVIRAVATGYDAAVAADRFMAGDNAYLETRVELTPADKELVLERNPDVHRRNRVDENLRSPIERKGDFETYRAVMSEAEAVAEAARCLRCGCSVTCGLCQKICSSFAIDSPNGIYTIDKDKCHACGMCAQLCPNKNIEIVAAESE